MKLNPLVIALALIPLVGCDTTYSVRAVDGYLNNALVWLDLNGDLQLDKTTEPYARSDKDGIAELAVTTKINPKDYSVVVSAIAGETIDSDSINATHPDGIALTESFLLLAPAGQTVVSPLSTLVAIKMHNDASLSLEAAIEAVAADLAISKENLLSDYVATEQGEIASKANAIVALGVLPTTSAELEAMMGDSTALDANLQPNLPLVQGLKDDQRLVKYDGSVIVTANIDTDLDGVLDGIDAFPTDANESKDSDKDGVGDNSDAYKDDASKSVADITTTTQYTAPTLLPVHGTPMIVDIAKSTTIQTFNDGLVETDTSTVYTVDSIVYGDITQSEKLLADGSFTRISNATYDFNLDGDAQYNCKYLDIGSKTATGETFWSYTDENDANIEGGNNGNDLRTFDDTDFSAREHLTDLSEIDVIAKQNISWIETDNGKVVTADWIQYPVSVLDLNDVDALVATYSEHNVREEVDNKTTSMNVDKDWDANGGINESIQFKVISESGYSLAYQRPVWADPQDGMDEEYADYNYLYGKTDELASYWYESIVTIDTDSEIWEGKRYIFDDIDYTFTKLVTDEYPAGLLFSEYRSMQQVVSDSERTEWASWHHYPLDGYTFTADELNTGQVYKIYQQQENGIWVGFNFSQWGSQSIEDLAGKVEQARSEGLALSDIDDNVIEGLNSWNTPTKSDSFTFDEDGNARTWYLVSNNPLISDQGYALKTVTLTDNGINDGWLMLSATDTYFLLVPRYDDTWNWYNAYERYAFGIQTIDTSSESFMWSSSLGEFYLDEQLAEQRVEALQSSVPPVEENTSIVGSWLLEEEDGAKNILTFMDNGTYIIIHESEDEPDDERGQTAGSAEYGNYYWEPESGFFTVALIGESDGWGGLYDQGETFSNAFLEGDSLILESSEETSYTLTRITSKDNPLIGGWLLDDNVLVFLSEDEYSIVHWQNEENEQPLSGEFGTYQFDGDEFTVLSAFVDSDGTGGLYNPEEPTDQEYKTLEVFDSFIVFFDENEDLFFFNRIGEESSPDLEEDEEDEEDY